MENLNSIKKEILQKIKSAESDDNVEEIRIRELGKKGRITKLLSELGKLNQEERKKLGPEINDLKNKVLEEIEEKKEFFLDQTLNKKLLEEKVDVTLPVKSSQNTNGRIHPVSQVLDEITEIFGSLGYEIADGPDIETEYYNFNALNIPESHPARQMHDTFYFDEFDKDQGQSVLRTHTSPVQVRTMEVQEPPIYIVAPGRTFRTDSADATHLPAFNQIEGLVIDKGITMGDLAGTIDSFVHAFFGQEVKSRLRPSYFPFTEPSAEFDISRADGSWLELGGCGMVHPNVLRNCNIDPEEWQGFAFGFGIDRLVSMRYQLDDIRELVVNDARFLRQF